MSNVALVSLPQNALCFLYEDRFQKNPSCMQRFVYNAVINPHLSDCVRKVRIIALTVLAAIFCAATLGLGGILIHKFVKKYKLEFHRLQVMQRPYDGIVKEINDGIMDYNEGCHKKVTDIFKEVINQIVSTAGRDLKTALILADLLPDLKIPQNELPPIDKWGFGTQDYTVHTFALLKIVDALSSNPGLASLDCDKDPESLDQRGADIDANGAHDEEDFTGAFIKQDSKAKRDGLTVLSHIRRSDIRAFMQSHYLASLKYGSEAVKVAHTITGANESLRYAAYAVNYLLSANFDKDDPVKYKKDIDTAMERAGFVAPSLVQAKLKYHIYYFMARKPEVTWEVEPFVTATWDKVEAFMGKLEAEEEVAMREFIKEVKRVDAATAVPATPPPSRGRRSSGSGEGDDPGAPSAHKGGGEGADPRAAEGEGSS